MAGSGRTVGWEGRFLQEKFLAGNRDVSRLDQGSVMGTCSCICGSLAVAPGCCCILALAGAAGIAPGRGPNLARVAGIRAWERAPGPGQSLTGFLAVPDQPMPGPECAERWGWVGDPRDLARAVLATLASSPLPRAPLFAGLRGHACTGHRGAGAGTAGGRQVLERASLLPEHPCTPPAARASGGAVVGQALAAGSLGKGANLPGLPPGPCQSPGKALSLPVLLSLPAGADPAPPTQLGSHSAAPARGCVCMCSSRTGWVCSGVWGACCAQLGEGQG